MSGSVEDPDADVLATIVSVLRNAFVTAFARSLEGSISLRDVKKELGRYGEKEEGKESKQGQDSDRQDRDQRKRDPPRPPKALPARPD